MKTNEIAKRLGYRPEVGFVQATKTGTVGFSCGKPEEVRELLRRVRAAGLRPSRNLIRAATT